MRKMEPVELSIIIPAYNEECRIGRYLENVLNYLDNRWQSYEIIVVDDGSIDRTNEITDAFILKDSRVQLLSLPFNRGKGWAVRTGMLQATGSLRLFADADGATPITELERLLQAVGRGADIAIASRAIPDDSCSIEAHFHRRFIGTIFNLLVSGIVIRGFADTQCGFKLFTKASAEVAFPLQRITDFGFDVELLYICRENGFKIAEVPVDWRDIEGSKVKVVKDSVLMFLDLLRIRYNAMCGRYLTH